MLSPSLVWLRDQNALQSGLESPTPCGKLASTRVHTHRVAMSRRSCVGSSKPHLQYPCRPVPYSRSIGTKCPWWQSARRKLQPLVDASQVDAFWLDWSSHDPSSSSWDWTRDANQVRPYCPDQDSYRSTLVAGPASHISYSFRALLRADRSIDRSWAAHSCAAIHNPKSHSIGGTVLGVLGTFTSSDKRSPAHDARARRKCGRRRCNRCG